MSEPTSREQQARADHERCLARWRALTDEQQDRTTFHPWQAHLRAPLPQ